MVSWNTYKLFFLPQNLPPLCIQTNVYSWRWQNRPDVRLLVTLLVTQTNPYLRSFIVNYLQSLSIDIGIAYIYCAYKEAKEQTLENLLASLVHQLIIKRSIPPKLEELYSAHIAYQTRPSISEYTDLLQLAVQSYDKVLVVIDALDECVEVDGTRKALVNELQKLKPKANLLVTSRDMPNIQRLLGGGARLDIQASENDIRLYIQDRISGSDRLSMYVEEDPDIYNSMTETIIGNAKGM